MNERGDEGAAVGQRRFSGRVVLVTGAASGIGRAGAQLFAREGARVVVATDANVGGADETCRFITGEGGEACFVRCDVSKEADVRSLVEECVRRYGRLDFAFNNAGIGPDGRRVPVLNLIDTPEDVWDRTLDVNLKGVFLCLKYEMRQMIDQGFGAIVNTSSVGAMKPHLGFCAYTASKAGLNGLTKAAALEGAPYNVRVNAIMPGLTQNTLLFEYLSAAEPEAAEGIRKTIPIGRLADAGDMAEAVAWLFSEAAAMITGQCVAIDGGMSIG